jgi:hypothetical protein
MTTHIEKERPETPLADGEICRLNDELSRSYERHVFAMRTARSELSPFSSQSPIVVQSWHQHAKTGR